LTPVDQIIFEEGKGDCLRTCIASILNLPVLDVPNFADDDSFIGGAIQWLSRRGITALTVSFTGNGYDQSQYFSCPEFCILVGVSPRATPEKRKQHAVVGRAMGWSFKVEHDPHPSRDGIVGNPTFVMWIFPPLIP